MVMPNKKKFLLKKKKSKYFLPRYQTNYGKKSLQYFGIKLSSEIPQEIKCLSCWKQKHDPFYLFIFFCDHVVH